MSYSKYYLYKRQETYDSGVTWIDTLETVPSGSPIATYDTLPECEAHDYSLEYLTFVAEESGRFSLSGVSLDYSLDDGLTWSTLTSDDSISVSSGDTVMWRGNYITSRFLGKFSSTNRFHVQGNIMSLVYGDNFIGQTSLSGKNYIFNYLFYNCSHLTSAENMILPATTLADYCYSRMFEGCTSLTTAPSVLPATTLVEMCYWSMFNDCTSLTTAPELPATTLAERCYWQMFADCTSLTTAPSLPATTLAQECYDQMFINCTSLTTAPVLSATTLAEYCYYSMFWGCSSLTTAPSLLATTLTHGCYNRMFMGCTSLTTAPELPATTLADYCYDGMFNSCRSLTTAPELLATTLARSCYADMFRSCISLTSITCLATDISASMCTSNWVNGVASAGTFVRDCNTNWSSGNSGIPNGWQDNCSTPTPSYSGQYLTFVAEESGTFKFSGNSINYSLDSGETWTALASNTNSPTVSARSKIMWKASGLTPTSSIGIGNFRSTSNFTVEGNAMSLYYGDNFEGQTSLSGKDYAFKSLFSGCTTLTSAENMALPATTLANWCYFQMFDDCTNLTTAPSLPATTLAKYCYSQMFVRCSSLTTAPQLPATALSNGCYSLMFMGCTSLTTALELPATILASGCYQQMFMGCTSLTTAPQLLATALVNGCYAYMFYNCTNLSSITCLATNISASYCTDNWVNGVAANGTFTRDCNTQWSSGNSGIPNNWQDNCSTPSYSGQYLTFVAEESGTFGFRPLESMNTVQYSTDGGETWATLSAESTSSTAYTPTIQAGTNVLWKGTMTSTYNGVANFSSTGRFHVEGNVMSLLYGDNFSGQTSLSGKNNAFDSLFNGCTTLTSAENMILPATTLSQNCYGYMFFGCTSLTTAPSLPATTLADACYYNMFNGCTSLTTAPTLPATTLANYCYYSMFRYCSSLSSITCLATNISATICTNDWLYGVAASGTFTKAASMTSWTTGSSGIPSGWTVVDAT